jgi:hypothetical protein
MSTATPDHTDRALIQEVRAKYGRALDQRDWELFASLFDEQVDTDFSAFGIPHDRVPKATVVNIMRHAFHRPEMKSHQIYSNFEITIEGEIATMRSSLVGRHVLPGFPGGDTFTMHARYHDCLRRTQQGWIITQTRLEVLFTEGNLGLVS